MSRHRQVGVMLPFQMLLDFLRSWHSSVFSLVFKSIRFSPWEGFLAAWLSSVRRHDVFNSSVYLLPKMSSFRAITLRRVKRKRKGKGNSSVRKQRMHMISGCSITLKDRNCKKGTHIAASLINSCLSFACLFPFIIAETKYIALGLKWSPVSFQQTNVTTQYHLSAQGNIVCILPAHIANSQRHPVLLQCVLRGAEEAGSNHCSSFTVLGFCIYLFCVHVLFSNWGERDGFFRLPSFSPPFFLICFS